jgi:L-fuculose-phosphate aldolase
MSTPHDPRRMMVEIADLMYTRRLTNSAGGNLSCRVGDNIFISPRYLGSKQRWQLREEQILVFDQDFNILEGEPAKVSRESRMHFACYQHFPQVNGVIHAHPQYLTVFASAGETLPPVNQYTEKFGNLPVVANLPSHSQDLADAVVEAITPRADVLSKNGMGMILAWHGVAVVGRDLDDAYDTLDRLEWSAQTYLLGRMAGLGLGGQHI